MTQTTRNGLGLLVAGATQGLAGMWWWAIAGMSHEVGTAHVFTSLVLVIAGAVTAMIGVEE